MTDKSLKLYSGSDSLPVNDYTDEDWTDWSQTELAMAADGGDSTASTWQLRDEGGVIPDRSGLSGSYFLEAHNVVKLTVGSNTLFNGRLGYDDRQQGRQPSAGVDTHSNKGRAVEFTITLGDANEHLRGIIVHNWVRAEETDAARVQALVAAYLSGSPRPTTNLNGSNFVITGSNTFTVPAKTYSGMTPGEVLQELAELTDKQMFVDVDDNLHYHGNDYAWNAPIRISDDPSDLNAVTCVPIDASRAEEARDTLSALRVYWGGSTEDSFHTFQRVDNTKVSVIDYWEDVYNDSESTTWAEASNRASNLFVPRKLDQTSYTVTIGKPGSKNGEPWTSAEIALAPKAGQLIDFKALKARGGRATNGNWLGDTFLNRRIKEVRWTFPTADGYYCQLILDRPRHSLLKGNGPVIPQPAPQCAPDATASTVIDWDWSPCTNPSFTDALSGTTGNPWGGGSVGDWDAGFCNTEVSNNNRSKKWAVSPGDVLHVTITSAKYGDPGGTTNFEVRWYNSGGTLLSVSTNTYNRGWLSHEGSDHGSWVTDSHDYTAPALAAYADVRQMVYSQFHVQHITATISGDPAVNDPDCVDYTATPDIPHDSPHYLPSDYVVGRLTDLQTQVSGLEPTTSASDPTVDDDVDAGFTPGDIWVNTATDEAFILVDNAAGAAVWDSITAGGGGVDVSEDGTPVVTAATEVSFVGADFDVTDGGSGEADVAIAAPSAITPTQLSANTDNWNPTGLSSTDVIRASTDASRNLTGITAPSVSRAIVLENIGSFNLVLVHNATSTAGNRFFLPGDANLTLTPDSAVMLVYDTTSSRWRSVGGVGAAGSVDAADVTFTPTSPMATTNVQAAIDELVGLIVLPLTATVGGEGVLVFDENDSLIGVEAY